MPELERRLPDNIESRRHVEPFLGGGAFFFSTEKTDAVLSDVNPELINAYEVVRDDVEGLIGTLKRHARSHSRDHYYTIRERYNRTKGRTTARQRAASFIYLNKTCFNGLHRVNSKGEFNVPVGSYKNPTIADRATLQAASEALQGVRLQCQGFEALLDDVQADDFVYLDPPYAPVSETASFTTYARGGFGSDAQAALANVVRRLSERGAKIMLSNSDVPLIRELYKGMNIDRIMAPRAISCSGSTRKRVGEVIVTNY